MKKSNPSKHSKDNNEYIFNWSILDNSSKNMFQRKMLEEYYIVLQKPTLNEQPEFNRLNLFRNDSFRNFIYSLIIKIIKNMYIYNS